jgi:hypothetical protein
MDKLITRPLYRFVFTFYVHNQLLGDWETRIQDMHLLISRSVSHDSAAKVDAVKEGKYWFQMVYYIPGSCIRGGSKTGSSVAGSHWLHGEVLKFDINGKAFWKAHVDFRGRTGDGSETGRERKER